MRSGQGTDIAPNGESYTGSYLNDERTGNGICRYQDGSVYRGQFSAGVRNGHGILEEPDGSHYDGEFKDDKKCGNGTMKYVDGSEYTGEWKNNMREGMGTQRYASGEIYEGMWHNDKRNGHGNNVTGVNQLVNSGLFDMEKLGISQSQLKQTLSQSQRFLQSIRNAPPPSQQVHLQTKSLSRVWVGSGVTSPSLNKRGNRSGIPAESSVGGSGMK